MSVRNGAKPPSFNKRTSGGSSSKLGSNVVSMRRPGTEAPVVRQALVLGEKGAAELIASQLRLEGFQAEAAGEPLPSLSDPAAFEKLRAIFARFAAKNSSGSGTPCIHPGVSVWAERPEIATLGEELGLDVICPPAKVLSLFSNKLNLLDTADRLGIPHAVMSFDPIYTVREVERLIFNQALTRKPFPFVLKAVKGGGSFGLQVVKDADDLESRIPLWVEQLRRNLGEVALFAERYVEGARHVLVPFVRYLDGRFRTFPMTDASLQSRYRKVIEFCPASGIDGTVAEKMIESTEKLAAECGYVGVGTLEYLVDDTRAYLVEGSARLNTGFHLWERVAGTSAVAWQLSALEGGEAGDEPECIPRREWSAGVAIRLYAEDSLLQLPQPGWVREVVEKRAWHFENPLLGVAAELDLQVDAGTRLGPGDYGMVGMLWAGAEDRRQALNVARGVLDEIWIAGSLQTNERFLSDLLSHPWVKEGMFHAGFVDEEFLPAVRPPEEILMAFPAVLAGLPEVAEPVTEGAILRWAVGDQWVKPEDCVQAVKWTQGPEIWKREQLSGVSGTVEIADGHVLRVCAYPMAAQKWLVRIGAWVLVVRRVQRVPGVRPKACPKLFAMVHGRIHAILYRAGTVVPAHQPLVILEALGSLVPHALPVDVRIQSWKKEAEDVVEAGDELAEFELLPKP